MMTLRSMTLDFSFSSLSLDFEFLRPGLNATRWALGRKKRVRSFGCGLSTRYSDRCILHWWETWALPRSLWRWFCTFFNVSPSSLSRHTFPFLAIQERDFDFDFSRRLTPGFFPQLRSGIRGDCFHCLDMMMTCFTFDSFRPWQDFILCRGLRACLRIGSDFGRASENCSGNHFSLSLRSSLYVSLNHNIKTSSSDCWQAKTEE